MDKLTQYLFDLNDFQGAFEFLSNKMTEIEGNVNENINFTIFI